MLEEDSKLRNRVGNVRKTPARLLKSVTNYGARLMNCLSGTIDDYEHVIDERNKKNKSLFKGKKLYQKAGNVPVGLGVYAATKVEKVVKPGGRLVGNLATSTKELGKDIKHSIGGLVSTKPVQDFSYSDGKLAQERPDTENHSFFDPNKPRTKNRGNGSRHRGKLNKNSVESPVETKVPRETDLEGKEIVDSDRISNEIPEGIELSNRGQIMVNYIKESHPELTIEFDDSTTRGHVKGPKSGNKIIVGSKKKEDVQQILYHEITHVMINDEVKGIKELITSIKEINQKKGKQLFKVSTHKHYDTPEKKTIEDTCELLALYSRSDWKFDTYMKKLECGVDKKLAKIGKSEAKHLKKLCENIMSGLKTIEFNKNELIDMAN